MKNKGGCKTGRKGEVKGGCKVGKKKLTFKIVKKVTAKPKKKMVFKIVKKVTSFRTLAKKQSPPLNLLDKSFDKFLHKDGASGKIRYKNTTAFKKQLLGDKYVDMGETNRLAQAYLRGKDLSNMRGNIRVGRA